MVTSKETEKLKKIVNGDPINLEAILPWYMVRSIGTNTWYTPLRRATYCVWITFTAKLPNKKQGKGKTLSATTALYANALVGKGVHL